MCMQMKWKPTFLSISDVILVNMRMLLERKSFFIKLKHTQKLFCTKCLKEFRTKINLNTHLQEEDFNCNKCDFKLSIFQLCTDTTQLFMIKRSLILVKIVQEIILEKST